MQSCVGQQSITLKIRACRHSHMPNVHTLRPTRPELCPWWAATDPVPWAVVSANMQASPCRGDNACLWTCSKMD